jgi:hypothetical protein
MVTRVNTRYAENGGNFQHLLLDHSVYAPPAVRISTSALSIYVFPIFLFDAANSDYFLKQH